MEVVNRQNLPDVIIVMDRTRARADRNKAFYLRVQKNNGDVDVHDLDGFFIPIEAKREAEKRGFHVDCWMEAENGRVNRFY